MSDQEFAAQEGVTAETPESAPEQTQEVEAPVEEQQPAGDENTEEEQGSEPAVPLKELIAQRKKRQKAEQEAAYWRGQAEAKAAGGTPEPAKPAQPAQQQGTPQPPDINNFETFEQYERAKDEYVVQMAEHRIAHRIMQQQQIARQKSEAATFEQRLAEAAKADPTIDEIRNDPTLPVSQTMAQLLQRTEQAPQLLKWLHNNREEATKIARMDPISAAMEFGRVEATIKATPKAAPKTVSAAPAPIKTVKTTAPASIDEDDLPMEEYYKRRTKQLYGR